MVEGSAVGFWYARATMQRGWSLSVKLKIHLADGIMQCTTVPHAQEEPFRVSFRYFLRPLVVGVLSPYAEGVGLGPR